MEELKNSIAEKGLLTRIIVRPIENTDESEVVFTFEAPFRMTLRNIAFYDVNFESEEDIDQYEEYIHIRMKDVLDDFYQLAPNEIYYESASDDYIVANEYFQEAFIIIFDKNDTTQ